MKQADQLLAHQRAARDAARAVFARHFAEAKVDFAPAVLKRRVVAELQQVSMSAATQALEIANDNRGVVAATTAALLLWLGRRPALAGAKSLVARIKPKPKSIWPKSILPKSMGHRVDGYWRKLKDYADE